jgi:L-ribulose-5-phosphate 3-epimerase
MQGRLLPPEPGHFQAFPRDRWRDEFSLAAQAGLDSIEWIYDVHGEDVNPLATDDGVAAMHELAQRHGVQVVSVCADWFMVNRLLDEGPVAAERLNWLLGRCAAAGIDRVVLPFVDDSRMQTERERGGIRDILTDAVPPARQHGVELHLETDLPPDEFQAFLSELPNDVVKVNYDSGNSAALGYSVTDELAAYGPRIGSFHVKDRIRGGGTVPLGEGDADLRATFRGLRDVGYEGDVILQVARPPDGDEVAWARSNARFVLDSWPR